MKTLKNPGIHRQILLRLGQLSPDDKALWGRMSVGQMVCHLRDAYQIPLQEKLARPAPGVLPKAIVKQFGLYAPMRWPKGIPTIPEVEQGKGGTPPGNFVADVAALLATYGQFCAGLPTPCVPHSMFGTMTSEDWMRWGYLHADHHLRQFGR